jgi:hypothetical protein
MGPALFKARSSAAVAKLLDSNILTAALVVVSAGLLGQYAAHGLSPSQWISGLAAVGGSIALAVIVRTWPKPETAQQAEG